MKKKLLSLLLCAVMVGGSLAACGNKATQDATSSKKDEVVAEDSSKLVYWSMWSADEPQAKVITEAVEKFTADTGVEVDLQFKGRSGQREGLQPALDAKQPIDLFDEDVNRVNGSWGKYLLDLEDLAKDFEAEHGSPVLFKVARNAYAQANGGEEKLHSIPYQPAIFGFFYNKTLFAKAGIDKAPTTWAELDAVAAKLKEAGIVPITGDTAYMSAFIGHHLGRYLGQDGVKALIKDPAIADKLASGDIKEVSWDDERVLKAAKDFEDFAKKGYFSETIASNSYPAGQNQEFAPGEAAMLVCGSWLPNEIKLAVADDFEWGYFPYPAVDGGVDGTNANNISNQVFAINKESKMPEEAFKLITYITSGEFDKKLTDEALSIPADKTNAQWPKELAEVKETFEATDTFYDWAVGVVNNGDLTPVLSENILKLMGGQITAEDFVNACKGATK